MYHSILVRTAITTVKANGPKHSIASVKEALFTVLLDILNGKQQQAFFTQLERESVTKRKTHERTRSARKGSQTTASSDPTPPPPSLTAAPHTQESDHKSDTALPPDEPLPTSVAKSARRPIPKLSPKPPPPTLVPLPTPSPPAPQTHAPDTSKIEAELEEFCRQLESSLQEDVECENLLKTIPEEEERGAAHPIGSSKFKQTVGQATTGNTILTTTHPKTRQATKGRLKK